jgi:hypothetical protein
MSARGLLGGVALAALLALAGAIGYAGLATLFGPRIALSCLVVALGGAYVLHLLGRSQDRVGRIAVFAAWLAITLGVALFAPGLTAALITQTLAISLVRTLYHHGAVLAGLADLVLSAFALSAAMWASAETGSVFLTTWSFFLVQALHIAIPTRFSRAHEEAERDGGEDPFSRAARTADAAIRRLATERSQQE